jgi:hypothetical protein
LLKKKKGQQLARATTTTNIAAPSNQKVLQKILKTSI